MTDHHPTLADLIAAWRDLPAKLRRTVRIAAAVMASAALAMLVAWGLGAFVTWQASPGNWSTVARGSVAGLWVFCQIWATAIAVVAAWGK